MIIVLAAVCAGCSSTIQDAAKGGGSATVTTP